MVLQLAPPLPQRIPVSQVISPATGGVRTTLDEYTAHEAAQSTDASQAWFWTAEWQRGEVEASAQRERGEGRVFRTPEEFLASLGD